MHPVTRFVIGLSTAVLLLPQSGFARDYKNANAAACQPYSATTLPADLSLRAHGLKNISADAEYVVCNITADTDASFWTDANPGYL